MRISTPIIVVLSNTQQVVSLKLTNTNYLYWWKQMKSYLFCQSVFHFVDGSVLCLSFHVSDSSAGFSLAIDPFFFIGSSRINLFWARYSFLFPWMYCALWWIVKPLIMFGALLRKLSPLCLILILCNFIGFFKIFGNVMLRLLYTCNKQNHYLMNWLLLASLSLLKTSISMCFMAFMVSSKTW